jgi:carboxymethylenebutenolidase
MTATHEAIRLSVADGTTMQAYVSAPPRTRPAGEHARTGVIVAHELFAVNPDIRGVADDLAAAGYLTIAPEFYHRDAPPGRSLERDAAGREEGFRYLNRLGRQQALDDTEACIGWLNSHPSVERIATIGFSAGGHLSYLAACQLPISRTAVLYGGWLPTTDIPMSQPTPTLDLTPGIRGRILYLVGDDDSLIDAGQRRQIRDALRAAGTDHEMISYPGGAHAFFWPGTPAFNQAARDDAWSRIIALLAALPEGAIRSGSARLAT